MSCDIFPQLQRYKVEKTGIVLWLSLGLVKNHREENYDKLISDMIVRYSIMGRRVSLKTHMGMAY